MSKEEAYADCRSSETRSVGEETPTTVRQGAGPQEGLMPF